MRIVGKRLNEFRITKTPLIKEIKAAGPLFMVRHLLTELNIYLKKRRLV